MYVHCTPFEFIEENMNLQTYPWAMCGHFIQNFFFANTLLSITKLGTMNVSYMLENKENYGGAIKMPKRVHDVWRWACLFHVSHMLNDHKTNTHSDERATLITVISRRFVFALHSFYFWLPRAK